MIGQIVTSRACAAAAGECRGGPEEAVAGVFRGGLLRLSPRPRGREVGARDPKRTAGLAGTAAWGTWHFALEDVIRQHPPERGLTYPEAEIAALRPEDGGAEPGPGGGVADAEKAAKALDLWTPALGGKAFAWQPEKLAECFDVKLRQGLAGYGWDEAMQALLRPEGAAAGAERRTARPPPGRPRLPAGIPKPGRLRPRRAAAASHGAVSESG